MGWFGLGSILKMIQANFKKRNCRNCLSLHVSSPEYLRGGKKKHEIYIIFGDLNLIYMYHKYTMDSSPKTAYW